VGFNPTFFIYKKTPIIGSENENGLKPKGMLKWY
jgi:hypothetical protein